MISDTVMVSNHVIPPLQRTNPKCLNWESMSLSHDTRKIRTWVLDSNSLLCLKLPLTEMIAKSWVTHWSLLRPLLEVKDFLKENVKAFWVSQSSHRLCFIVLSQLSSTSSIGCWLNNNTQQLSLLSGRWTWFAFRVYFLHLLVYYFLVPRYSL